MRRSSVVLLAILALILPACRSSSAEPTTVPEVEGGDTTTSIAATTTSMATTTTSSSTSTSTVVVDEFPITVETDRGPLTVAARPERVVSLSASHTEMLYAIGAGEHVVGTDLTSNFPEEADTTTKVDAFNFSIEEVVALEPDLVILAFDFQGEVEALEAVDVPFLLLGPPPDIFSGFDQLVTVGAATGYRSEAEALRDELRRTTEELIASAVPTVGVTIYHEVDETLFSATSSSFIGDIYQRLGLGNIADSVGGEFTQLTPEFIIDQNPQLIFLADAGFGVTPESVAARPGWDTILAVQDDNIVPLDTDIAGRWGPRTVELVAVIRDAVAAAVS